VINLLILSIDTGTTESAYVYVDSETYKIEEFGKIPNADMLEIVRHGYYDALVVEMFSSYGMRVGKEVFESIVMIGRCLEANYPRIPEAVRIRRYEVKSHICGKASAKDADVLGALKERFGDKGTKASPGFFYGIKRDCWQAFGLCVAYIDKMKAGESFDS